MKPTDITKLLLEADDDTFDAADYVKAGGYESAVEIYSGPIVRIICPLTIHTLNDYVWGENKIEQAEFDYEMKQSPFYIVFDKKDSGSPHDVQRLSGNVVFIQFEKNEARNFQFSGGFSLRDVKTMLRDDAYADMISGFVQYFQAQIAAKKNPRQAVTNLALLGRTDLAINYSRYLSRAKLPMGKAIEASLAMQKAGKRSRNKIARFMKDQADIKWGERGFYLLYDDWADMTDFFGKDRQNDYRKAAEDVFGGDVRDSVDAWSYVKVEDVASYIDDRNYFIIKQLLVGRTLYNSDGEQAVLTAEMAEDLTDDEIKDLLLDRGNKEGPTEDICQEIKRAGVYAEESALESAYFTTYQSALEKALGESAWIEQQTPKGKKTRLGFFVDYGTLEEWLRQWQANNEGEEFNGSIHDLAVEFTEKLEPAEPTSEGIDDEYFNVTLRENLGEIEMTPPTTDPAQPELPLENEPARQPLEPEDTTAVRIGDGPRGDDKVYKNIPTADAQKYVAKVPNSRMTHESLVAALLEREEAKSEFHRPENFDTVKEQSDWQMCAGANDWEVGYSAACVLFSDGYGEKSRLWITITHPNGNDTGEVKQADTAAPIARGKKAVNTWIKVAKKLHGSKDYYAWYNCFEDALNDPEMKEFIDKHGADKTKWCKDVVEAAEIVEGSDDEPQPDDPKDFLDRNPMLGYPQPAEVTYEIEAEPETDIDYHGHFATDEPAQDRKLERWITRQLEAGNQWAWCSVKVTAKWTDQDSGERYEGTDYLGGCCYKSEKNFSHPSGYLPQMKDAAYDDLIEKIRWGRENSVEESAHSSTGFVIASRSDRGMVFIAKNGWVRDEQRASVFPSRSAASAHFKKLGLDTSPGSDIVPYRGGVRESQQLDEAVYKLSTTQIDLPDDIGQHVISWGKLNIPDDALYVEDDGGCGRETEQHISVLYGLKEAEPSEALADLIGTTKPFLIELGGVSIFENEKYDVVKLDAISEELTNLSDQIRRTCPNENKFPDYQGHVTIAYVKPGRGKEFAGQDVFKAAQVPRDFWAYDVMFKGAGDSEDGDRVVQLLHFDKTGDRGHEEPANSEQRFPQADPEKEKEKADDAEELALAEADIDPKDFADKTSRPLERGCPECGSHNLTEPDDENLVDCLECGIWFNPTHPRNLGEGTESPKEFLERQNYNVRSGVGAQTEYLSMPDVWSAEMWVEDPTGATKFSHQEATEIADRLKNAIGAYSTVRIEMCESDYEPIDPKEFVNKKFNYAVSWAMSDNRTVLYWKTDEPPTDAGDDVWSGDWVEDIRYATKMAADDATELADYLRSETNTSDAFDIVLVDANMSESEALPRPFDEDGLPGEVSSFLRKVRSKRKKVTAKPVL
jgi:hypothetical protein